MGTFGITRARKRLGFSPSTAVQANIRVPNLDTGAAIGQAAIAGVKLLQDYDVKQANIELSEFQRKANEEINALEGRRRGNLDPDTYQQDFNDTMKAIGEFTPQRKRSAQASRLWLNSKIPGWQEDSTVDQLARADDNWDTEASSQIAGIKKDGDLTKLAEFKSYLIRRQLGPEPLDKSKAAKLLAEAETAQIEGRVATLKQLGMAGQEGAFDNARKLVQASSSVFTSEETLAELRSIDMIESFTDRKTKDLSAIRNLKINEDFIPELINKNLLPDTIQSSLLPDKASLTQGNLLSKRDWMGYAAESYEPAPTTTTPDGLNLALDTVIDFGKLRISKEGAYKELLNARYLDRSITDADFNSAIKRIQNPYPRQVTADIEAVTDENIREVAKGGFFGRLIQTDAEEERAKNINIELLAWIDDRIEQDKEPTRKEMQTRSAELRNGTVTVPTIQPERPKTKEDYDKLPSGTIYVDPDGKQYRKN